jgi:hypothetical protein
MNPHTTSGAAQRGVTLVIGLIFLAVFSLLAVSAIRFSSVNLKIAGNAQAQVEATAAAQIALEQMLDSVANFYAPLSGDDVEIDIDNDGDADYEVAVSAPECLMMLATPGYSANFAGFAPQDGYWDVGAVATDPRTGVSVEVHQGVKARVLASAGCP